MYQNFTWFKECFVLYASPIALVASITKAISLRLFIFLFFLICLNHFMKWFFSGFQGSCKLYRRLIRNAGHQNLIDLVHKFRIFQLFTWKRTLYPRFMSLAPTQALLPWEPWKDPDWIVLTTAQKMKFSIKDFFIFCAVNLYKYCNKWLVFI